MEDAAGFFLTEIAFVAMLGTWLWWRLFVFPTRVLSSVIFGYHAMHADHHAGQPLSNLFPSTMPWWFASAALLCFLQCLHCWWFFLFVRIAYRLLAGGAHEAANEEYEGGSDDEVQTKDS